MEPRRHYSRAPITEAIIELRAKLPEGITAADLEKCGADQTGAYPTKKKLNLSVGQLELGERLSTSASTRHMGFLFASADNKQVFQARVDGLAVSRLAPYDRWEPFRDEARRLWNVYRKVAKPAKVERMAVRYINRLDLPLPVPEMKDYFRTVPEVSPDLPQSLAGFFMQLNIPQPDIRGTLLLNQMVTDPPGPGVVSVVLDIDVFRDADLPADEEGLWRFCEELHRREGQIFEACITDRARGLIK
jgi:uncharacterized protein (TIGR04255 family)